MILITATRNDFDEEPPPDNRVDWANPAGDRHPGRPWPKPSVGNLPAVAAPSGSHRRSELRASSTQ